MRLKGKVAVISGAAQGLQGELMGIGGATAWLFVREGAKVVLGDIDEDSGQKTAAQIRERGGEALFARLDVTREDQWIEALETAEKAFGRLDILVNCAGTVSIYTVEELALEEWNSQMDIHAKGTFLGTKHAIPRMRKNGGGSIVNLSSMAGIVGSVSTAYTAAKGAVRLFTKGAALQYAREGIRVNSIHPGQAMTKLSKPILDLPGELALRESRIPLGRVATADEIAYGILYLASDESSYVTGSELVIDGGFTAQ